MQHSSKTTDKVEWNGDRSCAGVKNNRCLPLHGSSGTDRQSSLTDETLPVRLLRQAGPVIAHLHGGAGEIDFNLAQIVAVDDQL